MNIADTFSESSLDDRACQLHRDYIQVLIYLNSKRKSFQRDVYFIFIGQKRNVFILHGLNQTTLSPSDCRAPLEASTMKTVNLSSGCRTVLQSIYSLSQFTATTQNGMLMSVRYDNRLVRHFQKMCSMLP